MYYFQHLQRSGRKRHGVWSNCGEAQASGPHDRFVTHWPRLAQRRRTCPGRHTTTPSAGHTMLAGAGCGTRRERGVGQGSLQLAEIRYIARHVPAPGGPAQLQRPLSSPPRFRAGKKQRGGQHPRPVLKCMWKRGCHSPAICKSLGGRPSPERPAAALAWQQTMANGRDLVSRLWKEGGGIARDARQGHAVH